MEVLKLMRDQEEVKFYSSMPTSRIEKIEILTDDDINEIMISVMSFLKAGNDFKLFLVVI